MNRSLVSLCALMCGVWPVLAQAQGIDYGSLSNLFGEPVTTAATGTPLRASEVAANMTIITADEIRQSGSRNIPQILSRVSGLDIMPSSSTAYDVGVRGYQQPFNPRLLVLIDGRQVFMDDYSRMQWDNLPVNVDDIRQIEVVKGASSALFGSNATGGVVNIITYSPLYDHNNVATIGYGTQNTVTGDVTTTLGLGDRGGVKVSAGGLNASEFNTGRPAADNVGSFDAPFHRYVAQRSTLAFGNDFQINTQANFSEKQSEEATVSNDLAPVHSVSYSAGGGFVWQTPYGMIKNNNYINHSYVDVKTLGEIVAANTLVVSQLEDQFKLGPDHTFRALVEYRHKDFKVQDKQSSVYAYPQLDEDVYALSGTWLWQMTDALSATNALRFDQNDMRMDGTLAAHSLLPQDAYSKSFSTVAVNSGLVYKASEQDTFRATYGRGVQNPSEIESGFNIVVPVGSGVNYDVVGNPNLKPTIVDNYELGYERKLPALLSTAKAAVYYTYNHDLKAYLPAGTLGTTPNGLVYEVVNVGDSRGIGSEIELKGSHPSGFRWDGSYSYQTVRDAALVASTLGYGNSAPEHHVRLLLGYTTGKWEFDASGHYVTSTSMLRSLGANLPYKETAGYESIGGRIGYQLTDGITAALSGVNLTRDHVATSVYPDVERQVLMSLTAHF